MLSQQWTVPCTCWSCATLCISRTLYRPAFRPSVAHDQKIAALISTSLWIHSKLWWHGLLEILERVLRNTHGVFGLEGGGGRRVPCPRIIVHVSCFSCVLFWLHLNHVFVTFCDREKLVFMSWNFFGVCFSFFFVHVCQSLLVLLTPCVCKQFVILEWKDLFTDCNLTDPKSVLTHCWRSCKMKSATFGQLFHNLIWLSIGRDPSPR